MTIASNFIFAPLFRVISRKEGARFVGGALLSALHRTFYARTTSLDKRLQQAVALDVIDLLALFLLASLTILLGFPYGVIPLILLALANLVTFIIERRLVEPIKEIEAIVSRKSGAALNRASLAEGELRTARQHAEQPMTSDKADLEFDRAILEIAGNERETYRLAREKVATAWAKPGFAGEVDLEGGSSFNSTNIRKARL